MSVKAIEENKRILIEWPGYGSPTLVEWTFAPRNDGSTFVTITNTGFTGSGDEVVKQVIDSTGGFTFVLSGLKAYLEHNIMLNLTADHNP